MYTYKQDNQLLSYILFYLNDAKILSFLKRTIIIYFVNAMLLAISLNIQGNCFPIYLFSFK